MVTEVFAGIDAGKGLEIANEMGLIEVAAVNGHIRPGDGTATRDAPQNRLKAPHATKELRGHADVQFKELDEAA